MNRNRILLTACAVLATALVATPLSHPVQAARTTGPDPWLVLWRAVPCTTVTAGMSVEPTHSFHSPNGKFHLRYQKDGRVGLYDSSSGTWTRIWMSEGPAVTPGAAAMEADGNFTCRDVNQALTWSTGTAGRPGAFLAVRDDGDLAIIGPDRRVVWARPGGPLATHQAERGEGLVGIAFA